MNWRSLSVVAFDTETTGFYPETGDRVIEFAGVEFRFAPDGSVRDRVEHHFLVNPERPIPRDATEVSGIRDEDVAKAPLFASVAPQIHALLARSIVVAHNLPFDQRFLSSEFGKAKLRWPATQGELDTLDLSRRLYSESREHNLGAVSQRMGVSLTGAHRATNDARACGEVLFEIIRRHEVPNDLEGLLRWADGVGAPPSSGPFALERGAWVFTSGRFIGQPVEAHPDELAWMGMARHRTAGGWDFVFDAQVREWAARFLRVRASGRNPQGAKGFGPLDWGIDPPFGTPA